MHPALRKSDLSDAVLGARGTGDKCMAVRAKPKPSFPRTPLLWPPPWTGRVFMLLWLSLLWVSPLALASAPKAEISLEPPWTIAFQGEMVRLTCNGLPANSSRETTWFRQHRGVVTSDTTPGNTYEVRDSGEYQCQAHGSRQSDPVSLVFSKAKLILQAPTPVFEGDALVLRCRAQAGLAVTGRTVYKHEVAVGTLGADATFRIAGAGLKDNGEYHCRGHEPHCCSVSSNGAHVHVRELFPRPVLRARPPSPTEGHPMTLTCQTQLPAQRADVQLRFCFFREDRRLGPGCHSSPELEIAAVGREDTGPYQCQAHTVTHTVRKTSHSVHVQVQRAAVRVQIRTRPAPESVFEGQELTLVCAVDGAHGPVRVSWHRRSRLGVMATQLPPGPELRIRAVQSADAGQYHCEAGVGPASYRSKPVTIDVRAPVSRPVLTLSPPGTRVLEGQVMTLHCEAPRGSPPILYQIFHEDAPLWETKATSQRARPFRFTVTAAHSGNFYCVADNGGGAQRSRPLTLSVTVPVPRPVLTLSPPGSRAFEGQVMTLHCEAWRGSPPILYQFYHEDGILGSTAAPSGGGVGSFHFPLTAEHSGNYYCTADNGFGPQRSEAVTLAVVVPASRPVLTLGVPGARAVAGTVLELRCEAGRGSPPILYRFYHEDVSLGSSAAPSGGGASFNLSLTAEHSGNYSCEASNELGAQRSEVVMLRVTVPVSRPILTLGTPKAQAVAGTVLELRCEAHRGSPPILYQFYHEDVTLGSSAAPSGGASSFNLSLTAEHSGNYTCEADNGVGAQHSEVVTLNVTVPASRPVLALGAPRTQAVLGDVLELRCEAHRGSPPILYQFYHEDVTLGSTAAPSGGGVGSFHFPLTAEHSGNYYCTADNGFGPQRSEAVTLAVVVPASRPVLTLGVPGARAVAGTVLELRCEAGRGSPPILYRFYHEDVSLGSSAAPSGGGASFNLSLTAEHSGNYSCEADNGLGARRSETVTLSITGPSGRTGGPLATGVTGVLLSLAGLAALGLLLYRWLPGSAGGQPAAEPSSPPDVFPQEPTYHNVPAWVEMQPVYSNVNPTGDVVYSEVRSVRETSRRAAATTPGPLADVDSAVIYSQVKVTSPPGSRPLLSASSAPHR